MSVPRLVIIGAGGLGREALDIVEALNQLETRFEVVGFLDDNPAQAVSIARRGTSLLGGVDQLESLDVEYVIAIGSSDARRRIDIVATRIGRLPATVVHPLASVGSQPSLGPGTLIAAGARLTTNIELGRHVQVHTNATIGHDSALEDYVTVLPGANVGGNVVLERGVTVGSGAIVIQGVQIGQSTVVGAGAVVTRDLPAGVTAVGVPAKPLVK